MSLKKVNAISGYLMIWTAYAAIASIILSIFLEPIKQETVEYTVIDKVQEVDILYPDYYIILKNKTDLKKEEVSMETYSDIKIGDKRYCKEFKKDSEPKYPSLIHMILTFMILCVLFFIINIVTTD